MSTACLLQELFTRAGAGDLDGVVELWHERGTLEDVTLGRRLDGKPAVRAYLQEFFTALSELSYSPELVLTEGARGVVMWRGQSRLATPIFGFPASEQPLTLRGVDVFQIEDDLVHHEWSWYGDGWLAARLTNNDRLLRNLMPS
jgi:steroid delta-isomerase-like uncharacterized protein